MGAVNLTYTVTRPQCGIAVKKLQELGIAGVISKDGEKRAIKVIAKDSDQRKQIEEVLDYARQLKPGGKQP